MDGGTYKAQILCIGESIDELHQLIDNNKRLIIPPASRAITDSDGETCAKKSKKEKDDTVMDTSTLYKDDGDILNSNRQNKFLNDSGDLAINDINHSNKGSDESNNNKIVQDNSKRDKNVRKFATVLHMNKDELQRMIEPKLVIERTAIPLENKQGISSHEKNKQNKKNPEKQVKIISNVKAEVANLRAMLNRGESCPLDKDNSNNIEKNNALQTKFMKLGDDYDKLNDIYNKLKCDHNNVKKELEKLKKKYSDLKTEFKESKKDSEQYKKLNEFLQTELMDFVKEGKVDAGAEEYDPFFKILLLVNKRYVWLTNQGMEFLRYRQKIILYRSDFIENLIKRIILGKIIEFLKDNLIVLWEIQ